MGKLSAVDLHSRNAEEFDNRYRTEAGFMERKSLWTALIQRHSSPEGRALDLGCGSGEILQSLAGANREVTGLDGSAEMLAICARKLAGKPNVTLICADVGHIRGLPAGAFNLVAASSLLEYLDDMDGTLEEVRRLLAPGGVFIMSLPNAASVYRRVEPLIHALTGRPNYFPFIRNKLTLGQLAARLAGIGLPVDEAHYLGRTLGLSTMLRPLGMRQWSENLMVVVCRKPGVRAARVQ